MISYSSNDLLKFKNTDKNISCVDNYRLNIFYYNKVLNEETLRDVVHTVNNYSEKYKTDFVNIFSYLGPESVYDSYKHLVLLGLDINIKNEWGFTILHYAYKLKDMDFVEYLLNNGADPDAKITKGPFAGKTPIDF